MIEPKIVHLKSDEAGNWNYKVANDFKDGLHTVVVVDDDTGNESFSLFEVIRDASYIDLLLSFLAFLLLILIILFSIKNISLIKKLRRQKRGTTWFSTLVIFISVILISVLGYFNLGNFDLYKNKLLKKMDTPKVMEVVKKPEWRSTVSGRVLDPITNDPVADVDLAVDDVFIKTAETGQFVFIDMDLNEGIKITHPMLIRSLRYIFTEGNNFTASDIYFNSEMFNVLISIANLEARGDFAGIYDQYLADSVRSDVSKDDFIKNYDRLFFSKDVVLQELVFGDVYVLKGDRLNEFGLSDGVVFRVKLFNDGKSKVYNLFHDKNGWRMM